MPDNSIINVGELSKPATVLIEKISEALGGIARPYQMVRVAKAEAEVARIKVVSDIEITGLHRRAFQRWLAEEAKKQTNIEEIAQKALPLLEQDSNPEDVQDDWIADFFDKCRLVSDHEMQHLWASLLAGEANSPGSYSKRTISILASLDKAEAELFTNLCTFCWDIDGLIPLVYDDAQHELYRRHGINFEALAHLESIGLIKHDAVAGFRIAQLPAAIHVSYFGAPATLKPPNDSELDINIGEALLTQAGRELAPVCGAEGDPDFREYVLAKWRERGCLAEENRKQATASAEPP